MWRVGDLFGKKCVVFRRFTSIIAGYRTWYCIISIPFYVLFFDFRPTEKGLGSLNLTVICTVSSTVALYGDHRPIFNTFMYYVLLKTVDSS